MPSGSYVLHFWFGVWCVCICVYIRGIWQFSPSSTRIMQAQRSEVKHHPLYSGVLFRLGTMETLAHSNSSALKCQSWTLSRDTKLTKRFSGTKSFTASKLLAFDLLSFAIKRHFSETSGKERKDDETYQQGHSRAQIYCTSYESTLFMGKKRLG